MKEPEDRPTARVGRPRSFDVERALDRALRVFWLHGYEGTTLTDLTRAMGINRPSLYAAFGDKEKLFYKAVDRYEVRFSSYTREALAQPTARGFAESLLRGTAGMHTDKRNPPGCLMVVGALACGQEAFRVRKNLNLRRAADETRIRERLEQARAAGDLPPDANPAHLARYLVSIIRGMVVQAVGGATRDDLEAVIELAMRAWPASSTAGPKSTTRLAAKPAV